MAKTYFFDSYKTDSREELSEEDAAYFAKPQLEEDFEKSSLIFKKYNPEIVERQDL